MTTTIDAASDAEQKPESRLPARFRQFRLPTGRALHATVIGIYVLGAFYITARLWKNLTERVTANNVGDYAFFQFVFEHAAQSIVNWDNPFINTAINAPWGVNMMANTSMLALSVPLAPITLLFGGKLSFAIALVIGLAGTATAWYYFFLKHVTKAPLVAFCGGILCGFSPGMLSHSSGHPNIVAQFMLPLIISRVIQMREPGRAVRNGVILGLMCVYQMFLNEELLLFTAMVCLVMTIVYALSRRDQIRAYWRPFVGAGLVTVGVVGVLMAYPLWFQFFGPQSYTGPFAWAQSFGMDIAAFPAYSTESIGGPRGVPFHPLATNATEENAFLGWPLCLAAIAVAVYYRKVLVVRLAAAAGLLMFLSSLGNTIRVNDADTPIPGPWRLVSWLPLFDSIIVTRMALVVVPAIAVLMVFAGDRLLAVIKASGPAAATSAASESAASTLAASTSAVPGATGRRPLIAMAAVALATIAIPLTPTPIAAIPPAPVPEMFANGQWRQYVDEGGTIMPVPPASYATDSMHWAVDSHLTIPLAGGYFLGPRSETDRTARYGRDQRFVGSLLATTISTGTAPRLTDSDKQRAAEDLRYWNVDLIVLAIRETDPTLRDMISELVGTPARPIDVGWMWDVRSLT